MNPSPSSHDHPEAWLDALLRADAAQETALLGEADAAFSTALLARLPAPQLVAPALPNLQVPRLRRLLGLISACALAIVVALLFLTLPDLVAVLPNMASGDAALLSLPRALPSLVLLGLLCWWSWLLSREA